MPPAQTANPLMTLMPIIMLVLIMYFLMWAPQKKEAKRRAKMLSEMKKGDAIVTSGGVHGVIAVIRGNLVDIKVSDEVKITFSKDAISYVKAPQDLEQEAKEGQTSGNKVEVIK